MTIGVVGSRTFDDYPLLERTLNDIINNIQSSRKVGREEIIEIISGGANGADSWAEIYAIKHNIKLHVFEADWNKYGKKAGILRNKDIVANSDMIVAFWDGWSAGTLNTLNEAKKQHVETVVVHFALRG